MAARRSSIEGEDAVSLEAACICIKDLDSIGWILARILTMPAGRCKGFSLPTGLEALFQAASGLTLPRAVG
jgi:hypothetical protein